MESFLHKHKVNYCFQVISKDPYPHITHETTHSIFLDNISHPVLYTVAKHLSNINGDERYHFRRIMTLKDASLILVFCKTIVLPYFGLDIFAAGMWTCWIMVLFQHLKNHLYLIFPLSHCSHFEKIFVRIKHMFY